MSDQDFDLDEHGIYHGDQHDQASDQDLYLDEDGIWRDDPGDQHWNNYTLQMLDSEIASKFLDQNDPYESTFHRSSKHDKPAKYSELNVHETHYDRDSYTTDSLPPDEKSLNISELEASESNVGEDMSFGHEAFPSDDNLDFPELYAHDLYENKDRDGGSKLSKSKPDYASDLQMNEDFLDIVSRTDNRDHVLGSYNGGSILKSADYDPDDIVTHTDSVEKPVHAVPEPITSNTEEELQPKITGESLFTQEEPIQMNFGGQSLAEFEHLEAQLDEHDQPEEYLDGIGSYLKDFKAQDDEHDEDIDTEQTQEDGCDINENDDPSGSAVVVEHGHIMSSDQPRNSREFEEERDGSASPTYSPFHNISGADNNITTDKPSLFTEDSSETQHVTSMVLPSTVSYDETEDLSQSSIPPKDLKKRFLKEKEERKEKEQTLEQLSKEYNTLLKQHAEAKNVIDQLRLGAKVNLYTEEIRLTRTGSEHHVGQSGEGSKPKASSHGHVEPRKFGGSQIHLKRNSDSRPDSRTSHRSASAWSISTAPAYVDYSLSKSTPTTVVHMEQSDHDRMASSTNSSDCIAEESVKLSLLAKSKAVDDQIGAFEILLADKDPSLDDQDESLKNIKDGLDSLNQDYLDAKRDFEYRLRQGLVNSADDKTSTFDQTREISGEIHRLEMKVDDLDHAVQKNLKTKVRRVPFQTPMKGDHNINMSKTEGSSDVPKRNVSSIGNAEADVPGRGEGLSPRRPPSIGSTVGAAGDIDQTLHQLNKDYNSLMDHYRKLKQFKETPDRDKKINNLLKDLKEIYVVIPDHRKPALPPELDRMYNPVQGEFVTQHSDDSSDVPGGVPTRETTSSRPSSTTPSRSSYQSDGSQSDFRTYKHQKKPTNTQSSNRKQVDNRSGVTPEKLRAKQGTKPEKRYLPHRSKGKSDDVNLPHRSKGKSDDLKLPHRSKGKSDDVFLPTKHKKESVNRGRSGSQRPLPTSALGGSCGSLSDTDSVSTASTVEERETKKLQSTDKNRHNHVMTDTSVGNQYLDSRATSSEDDSSDLSENEEVRMISRKKPLQRGNLTTSSSKNPRLGSHGQPGYTAERTVVQPEVIQAKPPLVHPKVVKASHVPGTNFANQPITLIHQPNMQYVHPTIPSQHGMSSGVPTMNNHIAVPYTIQTRDQFGNVRATDPPIEEQYRPSQNVLVDHNAEWMPQTNSHHRTADNRGRLNPSSTNLNMKQYTPHQASSVLRTPPTVGTEYQPGYGVAPTQQDHTNSSVYTLSNKLRRTGLQRDPSKQNGTLNTQEDRYMKRSSKYPSKYSSHPSEDQFRQNNGNREGNPYQEYSDNGRDTRTKLSSMQSPYRQSYYHTNGAGYSSTDVPDFSGIYHSPSQPLYADPLDDVYITENDFPPQFSGYNMHDDYGIHYAPTVSGAYFDSTAGVPVQNGVPGNAPSHVSMGNQYTTPMASVPQGYVQVAPNHLYPTSVGNPVAISQDAYQRDALPPSLRPVQMVQGATVHPLNTDGHSVEPTVAHLTHTNGFSEGGYIPVHMLPGHTGPVTISHVKLKNTSSPGKTVRYYIQEYKRETEDVTPIRRGLITSKDSRSYIETNSGQEFENGLNDSLHSTLKTARKLRKMSHKMKDSLHHELSRSYRENL